MRAWPCSLLVSEDGNGRVGRFNPAGIPVDDAERTAEKAVKARDGRRPLSAFIRSLCRQKNKLSETLALIATPCRGAIPNLSSTKRFRACDDRARPAAFGPGANSPTAWTINYRCDSARSRP